MYKTEKICKKCGILKKLSEFELCLECVDNHRGTCRSCRQIQNKKYREENKEQISQRRKNRYKENKEIIKIKRKIYREKNKNQIIQRKKDYYYKNKDKILKRQKEYREKNKEKIKEYTKRYYQNNKDVIRERNKKYITKHKKEILEYKNEYRIKRMKNDPEYRIKKALRERLRTACKFGFAKKSEKAYNLLGADFETVKAHIESLFQEGMTWKNHGFYGWHIDHIIPCSSFDLTDPEEQKKCFHYTNLQPLWWKDNLSKGDQIL